MRIGLARHFLVAHRRSEPLDADGFSKWIAWYDAAEGEIIDVRAGTERWDRCYCSDLRRACVTAERLYPGPVERTPLLREVPFAPIFRGKLRLPLYLWQSMARAGWLMGVTQPEGRRHTIARVSEFLDHVCTKHDGDNVLVVGHGFLMQMLARDLRRRGFRGRVPIRPRGGTIYVFEKR
ncbi:MAG: phosphoglycerate mutase [Geminicoccaceae bacterium]|jgi:broad specificity phosphatase PhoE|nr:phosphoglycerate mutase [Geminicoccaceae bacterium]